MAKQLKVFDELDIPKEAQELISSYSERSKAARIGIQMLAENHMLYQKEMFELIHKAIPEVQEFYFSYNDDKKSIILEREK